MTFHHKKDIGVNFALKQAFKLNFKIKKLNYGAGIYRREL
jgi:hypothetical protein